MENENISMSPKPIQNEIACQKYDIYRSCQMLPGSAPATVLIGNLFSFWISITNTDLIL